MAIHFALSMLVGAFAASRLTALPGWPVLAACCALALAGAVIARRRPLPLACALTLGAFCWAAGWGQLQLDQRLDAALEGEDIEMVGVVASLPARIERGVRFDFVVEQAPPGVPARIALSWYDGRRVEHGEAEQFSRPPLPAGSRWQLRVRLKRPHGNMNPHGFDYEGWLFARGIGATGHVRAAGAGAAAQRMLDAEAAGPSYAVQRVRQSVRTRFERALGVVDGVSASHPWAGVLIALAIGDQRAILPAQWDLFERAGLTHLVSISGLHVTMVAALAGWLCAAVWRRVPALALRCPAQRAGVLTGLLGASAYCALAGFGIPAQRTLIMLATAGLALVAGRFSSPSRALALAVAIVLLLHPLAVIDAGFWLSFGAVALLFYAAAGDAGGTHAPSRWLRAQAAVTLGLAPLTLALFGRISLLAPLANLLAIPVISALVTPLVLLAVLLPADGLLWLAHALTAGLMALMGALTAADGALWFSPAPPPWAVVAGLAGACCILAPAGWAGRALAVPLMLPLFLLSPERPLPGDMTVTVLDVGQGLAVHVQTAGHELLFDTGPRYGAEADAGERLLLPWLRAEGVRRLDTLVISHADSDHSGGAVSLLAGMPVGDILSSVPAHDALRRTRPDLRDCAAGQTWTADGVRFDLLHPPPGAVALGARSSNALSCVLRVQSAHGTALITGDLLADGETALLRAGAPLAAGLLVSPHHGSRTSSTPDFVSAVGAAEVVHAVGYRNRFNHPHPAVVGRYAGTGAIQRRSDRDGAVRYRFRASGLQVERSRDADARYWHNRF